MTATAIAEERTAALAPLQPRPDQPERWHSFSEPVSFDVAAEQILSSHRADGERNDIVTTDLRSWAFGSTDQHTMDIARIPFAGRQVGKPLALRSLAFAQLCAKVGAPAPYLQSLPPKLQVANVNWGLANTQGPALLRLAGGEVRAVLSDRYAAADDGLLLEIVSDCLRRTGYHHDVMVRAAAVGPHTLLRITLPNEGVPVKVGDVIEHGIDLGNSELGLRSVQITPMTHRLLCLNGMRAWRSEGSVRMRHVGDPDRLRDQIADAIPVAFAEARGDIERWKRSVDRLMDSALEEIESLRGLGLSSGDAKAVGQTLAAEWHLIEAGSGRTVNEALKHEVSVFEVANAITSTAQARPTASRLSMEEAAHRYLVRRAS